MKLRILMLCFWIAFSLFYVPIIYSETKKPELGSEIKPNCKECHNRNKMTGGSAKPTVSDQLKSENMPTPPPDHIKRDKRRKTGQK